LDEDRKRPSGSQHSHQGPFPYWDKYDSVNQYYIDLGQYISSRRQKLQRRFKMQMKPQRVEYTRAPSQMYNLGACVCVLRLPNLPLAAAARAESDVLFCFVCVLAGARPHIKNHYRGHKLSLWLHLIPQLHRPGTGDAGSRHHHFLEEGPQFYDGECCVRLCIIYTTRLHKKWTFSFELQFR
jgi:hypothetical protein